VSLAVDWNHEAIAEILDFKTGRRGEPPPRVPTPRRLAAIVARGPADHLVHH
jgi:hypothetical protein